MSNYQIKKVHEFWNSQSCGERYAYGDTQTKLARAFCPKVLIKAIANFFPIGLK